MGFSAAVAVAGIGALADERRQASGGHGDADASDGGDTSTALLLSRDGAFALGDAADRDGVALPTVEAKDALGLGDELPPSREATFPRPCSLWRALA